MTYPMMQPQKGPALQPAYVIFQFERRAYPVGEGAFTIGRMASCDIVLREPSVSRIHAELTRAGREVLLRPVGSLPTIVNGVPQIAESALQNGDTINIGTAVLTFTNVSLPLGVTIVERSRRRTAIEDIANRRPTITNPIMAGNANPNQDRPQFVFRPVVLFGILAVIAAYYFGVFLR